MSRPLLSLKLMVRARDQEGGGEGTSPPLVNLELLEQQGPQPPAAKESVPSSPPSSSLPKSTAPPTRPTAPNPSSILRESSSERTPLLPSATGTTPRGGIESGVPAPPRLGCYVPPQEFRRNPRGPSAAPPLGHSSSQSRLAQRLYESTALPYSRPNSAAGGRDRLPRSPTPRASQPQQLPPARPPSASSQSRPTSAVVGLRKQIVMAREASGVSVC